MGHQLLDDDPFSGGQLPPLTPWTNLDLDLDLDLDEGTAAVRDATAANGTSSGSGSGSHKKLSHNAYERDRRKQLNELYLSLRSLLPDADHTKKLSIPTTVCRVLKYIPELQKQVEELEKRKEELTSANWQLQTRSNTERRHSSGSYSLRYLP